MTAISERGAGLEERANSEIVSKLKRAAKVAWRTATFNLGVNGEAVDNAYNYLKDKEGAVSGNDVWEVEHNLHMSKRSRKKLEDRLELDLEQRKEIRSDLQYKDGEGVWGHIQSGVNYAMDKTRLSKIFGNLEVYKNETTKKGLDFSRNTYISPEGSALITGLLVAGPAAVATTTSVAASLASYAKFNTGMSITSAFTDGLQNSQNQIMQNIGSYTGVAALGIMAGLTGSYYTASRTGLAAAQLGLSKSGHKKAAILAGLAGYGLSMAAVAACGSHDTTYDKGTHDGKNAPKENLGIAENVSRTAAEQPAALNAQHGSAVSLSRFYDCFTGTLGDAGYYIRHPVTSMFGLFSGFSLSGNYHALEDRAASLFHDNVGDAKTYARHVPNHDIVWHNNGTSYSDHNELRLQINDDREFCLSKHFDLDRINSPPHHDLPRGATPISKNVDVNDLVLRIGVDSNNNGHFDSGDAWFYGRFNSNGVVNHVFDAHGNEIANPSVFTNGHHAARGVMAQVDYFDAGTGKMHSIATALSGHGHGHHEHGGGHRGYYAHNSHVIPASCDNTVNNVDIDVNSHNIITNISGQKDDCPTCQPSPDGETKGPSPEGINTTLRVESSPWEFYHRNGTLDYEAIANTEGVRPEDVKGVAYTGQTVYVNPQGNHVHNSTVHDAQGSQEHLNGTWGNIFRPEDHHKYRVGEWKPGMPLQVGPTRGADHIDGNQGAIFHYEHEQRYNPHGQHTHAQSGDVAEAYADSPNKDGRDTSRNSYTMHTRWGNGNETDRAIEVRGNEERSRNIGRGEGFVFGYGVRSAIQAPAPSSSHDVHQHGIKGGQDGGPGIVPPGSGIDGGQQIGGPGIQ